MKMTKITALALAGLLTLGVTSVFADNNDDLVSQRQAAMKEDGKVLRGAAALTGADAVAALTTVQANYTKLPSLFPKDSVTSDSLALPAIWAQFDQFTGIFKKGADLAADGIAAAKAGDTAKYQADVTAIAATCDECHTTFRSKDD